MTTDSRLVEHWTIDDCLAIIGSMSTEHLSPRQPTASQFTVAPLDSEHPTTQWLDEPLPPPSSKGIRETKELLQAKYGRTVTDGEALEILTRLMNFVHLIQLTHLECSDTPSTPASQTTTEK